MMTGAHPFMTDLSRHAFAIKARISRQANINAAMQCEDFREAIQTDLDAAVQSFEDACKAADRAQANDQSPTLKVVK